MLCTATATYDLKHVETTNALLLVAPQQVRSSPGSRDWHQVAAPLCMPGCGESIAGFDARRSQGDMREACRPTSEIRCPFTDGRRAA